MLNCSNRAPHCHAASPVPTPLQHLSPSATALLHFPVPKQAPVLHLAVRRASLSFCRCRYTSAPAGGCGGPGTTCSYGHGLHMHSTWQHGTLDQQDQLQERPACMSGLCSHATASMDYESLTVHRGRTAHAVSWRPLAIAGEATTCRPLGAAAGQQRPCVSTGAPSLRAAQHRMAEAR